MARATLYQFRFSHYCEKARWILDFKGVPYTTRSLLAGPHAKVVKKVSGQTSVPVLEVDGDIIVGSDEILAWAGEHYPEPALAPADPALAEKSQSLQDWFNDVGGVEGRRALFCHFLEEPFVAADFFAVGQPFYKKIPYRFAFARGVPKMREKRKLDAEAGRQGEAVVREALDRVEQAMGPEGYLAGDRFSAADLTAAALMYPMVMPAELSFEVPRRDHPLVTSWLAKWADHPATEWVREMYRKHRRTA